MNVGRLWGVGAGLAMLLAAISSARPTVLASEILANPGFEVWDGGSPESWFIQAGTGSRDDSASVSGASLRLAAGSYVVSQIVPAQEGGTYAGSVHVAMSGPGSGQLKLVFMDAGFSPLVERSSNLVQPSSSFVLLTASGAAPTGSEWVRFAVVVESNGEIWIDEASLDEALPAPTPIPSETPTPAPAATATPAADQTQTVTQTSTATSTASQPTSTTTPSASSTSSAGGTGPTPTRTPTVTRTPTPAKTSTPTRTPTPNPISQEAGTSLQNGNFELEDGDKPAYWSKFGGEMGLTAESHAGSRAGTLTSTTDSTKWLHQLVLVEPGGWYRARGYARLAGGNADLFIRLSWYASATGSGSAISQVDSPAVSFRGWAAVDTGSVQAPAEAYSVRVRLMIRPFGFATGAFDDVEFLASEPATPTASATRIQTPTTGLTATRTPTRRAATSTVSGDRPPSSSASGGTATSGSAFTVVTVAGPNTLRISEMLSDPEEAGRDGPFEWVELVNVGAEPVSTSGWRIGDGSRMDAIPDVSVAPGGFLVIAGGEAKLPAGLAVVRLDDGQIGNGLNNDGDALYLVAPDGSEVDAVSFGEDVSVFEPAPPAPESGETLGVRVAGADPDALNWAITQRPTPGEPNLFPAAKSPGATSAGGDPQEDGQGDDEIQEGNNKRSPLPWILLGGAAGVGGAVAAAGGRSRAADLWRRVRRGG